MQEHGQWNGPSQPPPLPPQAQMPPGWQAGWSAPPPLFRPVTPAGRNERLILGILSLVVAGVSFLIAPLFIAFALHLWKGAEPQTTAAEMPPPASVKMAEPLKDEVVDQWSLTRQERKLLLDAMVKAGEELGLPETVHYRASIDSYLSHSGGSQLHMMGRPFTAEQINAIQFRVDRGDRVPTAVMGGKVLRAEPALRKYRRDFVNPYNDFDQTWQISPAGLSNLIEAIEGRVGRKLTPHQRGGIAMLYKECKVTRGGADSLANHQDAAKFDAISVMRSVSMAGAATLAITDEQGRSFWIASDGRILESPSSELDPDTLTYPMRPATITYPVSQTASLLVLIESMSAIPLAILLGFSGVLTVMHQPMGLRLHRIWARFKAVAVAMFAAGMIWATISAEPGVMDGAGWIFDTSGARWAPLLILIGLAAAWPVRVFITMPKPETHANLALTTGGPERSLLVIASVGVAIFSAVVGVLMLKPALRLRDATRPRTIVPPALADPVPKMAKPMAAEVTSPDGLTKAERKVFLAALEKACRDLNKPDDLRYLRSVDSMLSLKGAKYFSRSYRPLKAEHIRDTVEFRVFPGNHWLYVQFLTSGSDRYESVERDLARAGRDFVASAFSSNTSSPWELTPAGMENLLDHISQKIGRDLTPHQRGAVVEIFTEMRIWRPHDGDRNKHDDPARYDAPCMLRSVAIRGKATLEIVDLEDRRTWITADGRIVENPRETLDPDTLRHTLQLTRVEHSSTAGLSRLVLAEAGASVLVALLLLLAGVLTKASPRIGFRMHVLWAIVKLLMVPLLLYAGFRLIGTISPGTIGATGWGLRDKRMLEAALVAMAALGAVWPIAVLWTVRQPELKECLKSPEA